MFYETETVTNGYYASDVTRRGVTGQSTGGPTENKDAFAAMRAPNATKPQNPNRHPADLTILVGERWTLWL